MDVEDEDEVDVEVDTIVHVGPASAQPGILDLARSAGVRRVILVSAGRFPERRDVEGDGGWGDGTVVVHLRVGTPYGPGITSYSPVSRFVLQALTREPMTMSRPYQDALSLVHVWDIGVELDRLLRDQQTESTSSWLVGEWLTPRQIADAVAQIVHPVPIDVPPCPKDAPAKPLPDGACSARIGLRVGLRTVGYWLAYEEAT